MQAAGVSNADVRGYDDVGRARVFGWVVVVNRERGAVVELPERDPGGGGIIFEDFDYSLSGQSNTKYGSDSDSIALLVLIDNTRAQ